MALQNTELQLISHKEEAITWQNNYSDVKDELEKSNHAVSKLCDKYKHCYLKSTLIIIVVQQVE